MDSLAESLNLMRTNSGITSDRIRDSHPDSQVPHAPQHPSRCLAVPPWEIPTDVRIFPAAVRKSPSAVSDSPGAVSQFPAAVSSFLGAVSSFPAAVSSFPGAVSSRPVAVRHFPVPVYRFLISVSDPAFHSWLNFIHFVWEIQLGSTSPSGNEPSSHQPATTNEMNRKRD